jgi:4-hydroxybenzoate polyprenyltransferase
MPFAVLGFFLAVKEYSYDFDYKIFIYVIICMVLARNAAMAFNRYIDRKIDEANPRTADREIPAGKISPTMSMVFVIINSLLFILTTYFINNLCFILSPIALFIILFYSYTKRFTSLSHIVLGLGLAIAPTGAFIAVSEKFELSVMVLSAAVWFWTAGFDIIYALQDEEFDRKNNLYSIPAKFGHEKAIWISRTLHLLSILSLVFFAFLINENWLLWMGISLFSILIIAQHIIVNPNNSDKSGLVFLSLNGPASIIFAILTIASFYI